MSPGERRNNDRRNKKAAVPAERRNTDRREKTRRAAKRITIELWMEEISGENVYFRRAGNVSDGGVFFEKAIPHPLGTTMTLKFALPGQKEMVVARGEVVSTSSDPDALGMSIRFIAVEGNGRDRIRAYVNR